MRLFDYDPQTLVTGAFGILEPGPAARLCAPGEIDLLLVPGWPLPAKGARCGRGKGYYDRYLAQPEFRGAKFGVCYAHQLIDALPAEPHDVRMDGVILLNNPDAADGLDRPRCLTERIDETDEKKRRVALVLAGGGARGVAHIRRHRGSWRVRDSRLRPWPGPR